MNKKLLLSLSGSLLIGISSCEISDLMSDPSGSPNKELPEEIAGAKTYFEEYSSLEIDYELIGMHPGVIVPQWEDAITVVNRDMVSVNVPLFTEATYSGAFYPDSTMHDETYSTAILQRLVVVRYLDADNYNCYLSTIIPDKESASHNRDLISRQFLSGDTATTFSGTVLYSTVTTNYIVAVERYASGICMENISMLNPEQAVPGIYEFMEKTIRAKEVTREISLMSRNGGEFGGITLPGVTVIGTPGGSGGGNPSVPSLPPPPNPPIPNNPTPPGSNPPVTPPPSSGGSSGGGSGSSSGNSSTDEPQIYIASKTDKVVTKKRNIKIVKQTGQNCVTNVMDFIVKAYFGYNLTGCPFDDYYLEEYHDFSTWRGVALKDLDSFVKHFFKIDTSNNDIKKAIDSGHTVMIATNINGSRDYHNVLIIGYTADNKYIYADPTSGEEHTASKSYFSDTYQYIITGVKNIK